MQTLRRLLKPDWKRFLIFALLAALIVGADIQAYAFVDDVPGIPKPPLYDLLRPFDLWAPAMLLIAPLALLTAPFNRAGICLMCQPYSCLLTALYLYLLSSFLVFAHESCGERVRGKRWWFVVAVPFLLVGLFWLLGGLPSHTPAAFLVSSILLSALVALACLY
ncbi:MAG: hypothetical protein U9R11_02370, partial [Chloroflexota bacterium]|nr:hypothetical protein [Chloroflexota bacterium]